MDLLIFLSIIPIAIAAFLLYRFESGISLTDEEMKELEQVNKDSLIEAELHDTRF